MSDSFKRYLGPLRAPLANIRKRWTDHRRVSQWRRIVAATGDPRQFAGRPDGPRIVHLAMIGHMFLSDFEVPLALALAGRGARVEMIYDDSTLPLCEMTTADVVASGRDDFCRRCIRQMEWRTCPTPLKVRRVSEFCGPADLQRFVQIARGVEVSGIMEFELDGVPIGRPALMVALRHFRTGALDDRPEVADVLRKYVVSALISRHVAGQLMAEGPIHAALLSHGIYSSWEPALETFKKGNVPVAVYDRMTGKDMYQFNWNRSPNTGDISNSWNDHWRGRELTADEARAARDYIADRETFAREAAKFSRTPPQDPAALRARIGVPADKTALLLVSNLVWDAAAVGRDLIFQNTLEWVCKTIEVVRRHPDRLHLIVKPHPAEVMRGTRLFVGQEVRKVVGELPANVTVLAPDADINPMSLMKGVDVGIAHTSTAGLEMAALGKPVIPVSLAHYRGKGFTFDPANFEDYRALIEQADQLPARYSRAMNDLAIKYVYVRYFKYQQSLPLLLEHSFLGCTGYAFRSLNDLLPGRFEHLDFVCQAILNGKQDFVRE